MALTIPQEKARRYLVGRQSFLGRKGKEGICSFINAMGCVQMDPVSIVDRNHNLVLRNRVRDYSPRMLDELLYRDRRLFEYWRNQKSILPIEDFPYAWYRMRNHGDFDSPYLDTTKENKERLKGEIGHILARIRKDGPLSSADFGREGVVAEKVANRVLLLLWDSGDLMVHHVEGNRRAYDLTERVLPPGIGTGKVTLEEYRRFMLMKYLRADGLADARDPWRFGWYHMDGPERRRVVDELVKEGTVVPVRVEGSKNAYYLPEDEVPLLDSDFPICEKVLLIAPLDNIMWNRRMVREVFGFAYSWEIYLVQEKRTYGCYAMPMLHGTRFIGRVDPHLDRETKTMVINGIFMEPGVEDPPVAEIADALAEFCAYHGTRRIEITASKPEGLKGRLEKALSGML